MTESQAYVVLFFSSVGVVVIWLNIFIYFITIKRPKEGSN